MLLDSFNYLIFLTCTAFVCSFITNNFLRQVTILIASLFLFSTFGAYSLLTLFLIIILNYGLAFLSEKNLKGLIFSIAVNASIPFSIKLFNYNGFFNRYSVAPFLGQTTNLTIEAVYPIGVAFYFLSAVSYQVDIYSKQTSIQKNPIKLALFLSFFPKILAGPIQRAEDHFSQMARSANGPSSFQIASAVELIALGFFKKGLICDRLSEILVPFLSSTSLYVSDFSFTLFSVALAFFQAYLTISAYTDIARGSALLFEINLPINFNYPFLATNIIQLWSRIHITVASWFKDYIFLPIALSIKSNHLRSLALLFSFSFCGLWHGTNFHFLLWGFLNGFAVLITHYTLGQQFKIIKLFDHKFFNVPKSILTYALFTLVGLVTVVNHPSELILILKRLATPASFNFNFLKNTNLTLNDLSITLYAFIFYLCYLIYQRSKYADSRTIKILFSVIAISLWSVFRFRQQKLFGYTNF